jgi:uncharacterized protein
MIEIPERAKELVGLLDLQPHPEGGFYRETYRSEEKLTERNRDLLTSIYFLITAGNVSRFHRIRSDEGWYFHEGAGLTVHMLDESGHTELKLGMDLEAGEQPFAMVPAGKIFGSCLTKDEGYALVSCTVAPGFDFEDFELFSFDELAARFPAHSDIIRKLT